MTGVEAEMRATLQAFTKEGVWNYAHTPRPTWINASLGMVTLAGSQVRGREDACCAARGEHARAAACQGAATSSQAMAPNAGV